MCLLFPPRLGGSGFDLLHLDPRAIDLFEDVLDGGAPDERLGVLVPGLHKCLDRLLEIRHTYETATPNRFLSEFSKQTLHQIHPACPGRTNGTHKARMLL